MSRCHAETCVYWTGNGCVCSVLDLEPRGLEHLDEAGEPCTCPEEGNHS